MTIKRMAMMENDKEHFTPGSNSVAGVSGGYVYLAGDSRSGTLKGSETWPHGKVESTKLAVCRACGGVGFQRRGRMEIICRQCEGTGRVRVFTIVTPYKPGKEL